MSQLTFEMSETRFGRTYRRPSIKTSYFVILKFLRLSIRVPQVVLDLNQLGAFEKVLTQVQLRRPPLWIVNNSNPGVALMLECRRLIGHVSLDFLGLSDRQIL